MKKGISIWSFPPQSLADNLKLAADAGFDGVELALDQEGEISLTTSERELLGIRRTTKPSAYASRRPGIGGTIASEPVQMSSFAAS